LSPLHSQFPLIDLNDRSILVTGGTGSLGYALVDFITKNYQPRRLVIFSRDELKQYEMQQRYNQPYLRYFIGDVRDVARLEMSMRDIDFVVHAAALKHVMAAEYNPFECIRTNVHGAENVANAAIRSGVKRVIALSTDKAANPVNLYGASKLASDKIFIAANALAGKDKTRFSVVRYGNVAASRGSVIPLFERLISEGRKSLPITDRRMTRFLITLRHGIETILSSLEMMSGGETFVPKIPSVRIVDIADAMLPGCDKEFIGIRPGEKLHEMMISTDDARSTIELKDRYVIEPMFDFWQRQHYQDAGAKRLNDDFSYTSDTNGDWLSIEKIQTLLRNEKSVSQGHAA
jgi:UDP-N-acetylglucosamine 4,6-dehydratase